MYRHWGYSNPKLNIQFCLALLENVLFNMPPPTTYPRASSVMLYLLNMSFPLIIPQSWTHNISKEKEFLRKLVKANVIKDLTNGI